MVVAPGTGWPGDLATAATPVARAAADVRSLAAGADTMPETDARISVCRACPRLVAWREEVAATKRRAFALEPYWGRPVPGFGADRPQILVVGLAPAAHGANRTGRNFTGDRSGDFLYAALFRAGLANHPTSVHAGDGLALQRTRIVAAVRCAPPANLPTPVERDTCRLWLDRQLELAWSTVRAIVVLGGFGWSALWPSLRSLENGSIGGGSIGGGSIGGGSIGGGSIGGGSIGGGSIGGGSIGSGSIGSGLIRSGPVQVGVPARVPAFGHGVEVPLGGGVTVLGCYHVSQQNTFTGRLTEPMIDAIFARALEL